MSDENLDPKPSPDPDPKPDPKPDPEPKPEPKGGSNFYKEKLAKAISDNEELQKKLDDAETAKLTEKESFKELYELEKDKRVAAEEKSKKIATSFFDGLKMSAVKEHAIKAGIRDEAIEDINIQDNPLVQVETTSTGKTNVIGAEGFVETLVASKPHWFNNSAPPKINNGNPEPTDPKDMTTAELIKLEKTDKKKYQEEMGKRLKVVK